jgi:TolB-like protein/class 3 adenylate cyclase/Tfp pilus assembly protein PilF
MPRSDLPSGTVTFLFTDVEGSTHLLGELGAAAYAEELADHRRIIREACTAHGGVEVDTQGDAFFIAFPTAPGALQAAATLTERLGSGPVRVRVGLHTGTPVLTNEGYVGVDVHRAARIAAAGHGGQVLVSAATAPLVDTDLLDLGEHRFKDLAAPERIFQLGPNRFPPLKTLHRTNRREMAQSVAVLPFEVLGGTAEAEFLASGLHNDLLTALAKVPALTVISRTSVMGYRGTNKPIPHITAELNVGTIIEGAVQCAGRRVRLSVQLIDGVEDLHRWADHYDRELTTENLFAIQAELAEQIAETLHAELAAQRDVARIGPATEHLDSYRLAVEGRMQLDRMTEGGLQRAVELFEQAVTLDPDYAVGWVGLADSLALIESYGFGDSAALLARAEEAVHRALEIAPDAAEAQTSLGLLAATRQDGPASLREFERAMDLQPGYADAHNWHSWMSLLTDRADAALKSATRAVRLNPLSAEAVSNLALSYLAAGDSESGLIEARRASELSPGYTTADYYQGICLCELGLYDEAVSVLRPLSLPEAGQLTVPWAEFGPDAALAVALQASGDSEGARDILAEIDADEHPFWVGFLHAALGEREPALQRFSRVEHMGAGSTLVVHYHFPSVWKPLRGDPRHDALVDTAYRSWAVATGGSHGAQ